MKKIFSVLVAIIVCQSISAQVLQIKGRIMSVTKQPIEFANVILRKADSTFVTGGMTDSKGKFSMDNLQKGIYNLQVSSLGYQSKSMSIRDFTQDVDLGNIEIDSAAVALNEVVVTAANVINEADRKILLPSSRQMRASTNGFNLLQQLNLKRIQVDVLRNTISASGGGEVQLRINGVKSSIQEVMSLRPEDILRIEHHEDPGLRYGGAEAVIDYITRRRDSGGFIALDLTDSPHIPFGDNNLTAKFNYKKSEFGVFYYGGYRAMDHMWRENSETFNFADGKSLTRLEDGTPDKWAKNWHYMQMNYNYQEADKWFFNATLRGNINADPKMNFKSYLYPTNNPSKGVNMTDRSSSWEHIPSLDLYFQRNLKNQQSLILNVVGTYIDSNSERYYKEMQGTETLTDLTTIVNGNKYSVISEGIYEKGFKAGRFSTGIKHTQSFTNNEYTGSSLSKTEMKQSETYAYTEFQGKIKKFNYSLGIGGSRSWFSQGGVGYQSYTFRPTASLKYNFNDNSFLRYRGNIYSSAPSLSDLSNVEQSIDSLQIRRGNSNLKPVMTYTNSLNYDIKKGIFSGSLFLGHWYRNKPIMEETRVENNKFIRTNDNQQSWQKLNSEAELSVNPFKDHFIVKAVTGFSYFDSKGNNYHHTYSNMYYRGEASAYYKQWSAFFQIQGHKNNFFGETLEIGENYHLFGVMYKHKQLSVGAMMINPFVDNWKAGSENMNANAPSKNWVYIKESSRLLSFKVSYSFNFGRKYESAQKRLNNEDKDTGVMSSKK
ncbi:TonB-dependent receptor [uncultured Bacteroides sp.]|uniref:TonB-dependent receptor n=1 Tax=uncultured Bacteroides sp. TaxID=162156 RepID=UPI002AAC0C47|nr:TonB-dependent receptor [uncultured Bacteroides sp.]